MKPQTHKESLQQRYRLGTVSRKPIGNMATLSLNAAVKQYNAYTQKTYWAVIEDDHNAYITR